MISFLTKERDYASLWKIIERSESCTRDQFKAAVKEARQSGQVLSQVLLEKCDNASEEAILQSLSEFYGLPSVRLKHKVITPYILNLIPKEAANELQAIVFKKLKDVVQVGVCDPDNQQIVDFIKRKTGLTPELFITTPADIQQALKKYQGEISEEFSKIIEDSIAETRASQDSAEMLAQHVPVVRMVNSLLDKALEQRSSDIHIEPTMEKVIVRYRIDGLLKQVVDLPPELLPAVVARVKLLSGLKIDEHRRPQDGRFNYAYSNRDVAIRVSAIPTLYGNKLVLRLLDTKQSQFNLKALGLNKRDLKIVKSEILRPHGMILVTGPTGSGKTTTLYTILKMLNREQVNICTVEDPIEYGLEGVNQMQVNPTAGLTFASGLRSILRQDPDIVMVGEIRDLETAEMALNASMTGHLVLSTLHTNNAFLSAQRLTEMGIPGYAVGSVLNLVIGQRLVRTICRHCRRKVRSVPKLLERYHEAFDLKGVFHKLISLELLPPEASLESLDFYEGAGCSRCADTGYQGRLAIYEVMPVTEALSSVISKDTQADHVRTEAIKQGVLTRVEDGLLKVFTGFTTFEEVLRVSRD